MKKLLYELISQFETITIFGHVNPDGDCYGSQIGLRDSLKLSFPNKRIYALGSGLPSFFNQLGQMDDIEDDVINSSLAIVLDVADGPRIEDQRYQLATTIFKVDHHIPDYNFGHHAWVNTDVAATSLLVCEFIQDFKLKLSPVAASALALGIISDTGRFLFGNLNRDTFQAMSFLMDQGANLRMLYDAMYKKDINDLQFEKFVFENYQTTPNGVIYCVFSKDNLQKLNLNEVESSTRVNLLANFAQYPIWAFFAEGSSITRAEFRSSGLNVQKIAFAYGGGGHTQASGASLKYFSDIPKIINELDQLILKGNK